MKLKLKIHQLSKNTVCTSQLSVQSAGCLRVCDSFLRGFSFCCDRIWVSLILAGAEHYRAAGPATEDHSPLLANSELGSSSDEEERRRKKQTENNWSGHVYLFLSPDHQTRQFTLIMLKMQRTLEKDQNFTIGHEMKLFFSFKQFLTFTLQYVL